MGNIYGWINTKDCVDHEVGIYKHFDMFDVDTTVYDEQLIKRLYPDVHKLSKEFSDECASRLEPHQELIDAGDHPEWHVYEMWYGDADFETKGQMIEMLAHQYRTFRYGSREDCLYVTIGNVELTEREKKYIVRFARDRGLSVKYE